MVSSVVAAVADDDSLPRCRAVAVPIDCDHLLLRCFLSEFIVQANVEVGVSIIVPTLKNTRSIDAKEIEVDDGAALALLGGDDDDSQDGFVMIRPDQ